MTPHVPLDRVLTAVRSVHRQKETAVSTPEPSATEQAVIDRFDAAEPAEESFDAVAACRRVLDLAAAIESGEVWLSNLKPAVVAALMRVAVADSAAVLCDQQKEG